ncbi:hypothetical protein [Leptospira adleri]|uniref:hypothetical protein n=1 Tax=Leptospira adleri TaxID=2023186 RepID=UPI0010826D53|nr:hypothetical protein [Leptospira adleri]TGM60278.1 hypothetical protein EHQ97_03670 [Leptospira adleri]
MCTDSQLGRRIDLSVDPILTMKNIIPDKLTINRKRNQVIYSYDRFQYSSLPGIFISLLFLITLLFEMIDFRISKSPFKKQNGL